MSEGIKLSKKYGVNPTIPVCFFCGEDKNEVALLGKIGDKGEDIEAPRRMILDYNPCNCCKENFSHGVLLVSVNKNPVDERPPIQENLYPTGAHVVLKTEAFNKIFDAEQKDGGVVLFEEEGFNELLNRFKN